MKVRKKKQGPIYSVNGESLNEENTALTATNMRGVVEGKSPDLSQALSAANWRTHPLLSP